MAGQSKDSSGITAEDVLHRPLKRETFSGRMARLHSEKATPEERASAAAWRAQREHEQLLEQMRQEIERERAASDEFYRK